MPKLTQFNILCNLYFNSHMFVRVARIFNDFFFIPDTNKESKHTHTHGFFKIRFTNRGMKTDLGKINS